MSKIWWVVARGDLEGGKGCKGTLDGSRARAGVENGGCSTALASRKAIFSPDIAITHSVIRGV